ncbi:MAG: AtpZ/AtpI family protein [Bacteroidota bacterium]
MSPQKSPNDKGNDYMRKGAKLSGMALQMGLTIYLGNALGKWLDKTYELGFAETALTLLSIAASMYLMIHQVTRMNK